MLARQGVRRGGGRGHTAMGIPTDDVANQSSELVDYNLFTTNPALVEALAREGSAADHDRLAALGGRLGTAEMFLLGDAANRNTPVLKIFDRFGRRRDEVEFHPAWHELMRRLVLEGLHTGPWAEPRPGAHVARAAGYMLWAEIENGTQCPATMTYGAVPALAHQPQDSAAWRPLLLSRQYAPRFVPTADKQGALMGMGMTEKQGGSDVRSNTTRAVPAGARGPGREYRLTGHKWFFSAPMCDAFLVLAQAPAGLSCFFVPRFLADRSVKDRKSTRLNSSHGYISYAVFCLKKKKVTSLRISSCRSTTPHCYGSGVRRRTTQMIYASRLRSSLGGPTRTTSSGTRFSACSATS